MQGDATPGQAFHVGHWRIVIEGRVVVHVLLQNDKSTRWGRVVWPPGRARGNRNAHTVAVYCNHLSGDGHNNDNWAFGRAVGIPGELPGLEVFGIDRVVL